MLVLAGRRGPDDPLADFAGAPHRALVDIGGTPMLERVLVMLRASPRIAHIWVSIDRPDLLEAIPGIAALIRADTLSEESPRVTVLESAASPSQSVLAGLDAAGADAPLLVTTADHALLTHEILHHFLDEAEHSGADVAVALVAEAKIRARFPSAKRTYLRFRDGGYSGANLFAFRTPPARAAAVFWRRAEEHRKQPWRLVRAFGLVTLLLFLLRRLDLTAAFERASRVVGVHIVPVAMPFAEAAVDVDKPEDLELVRSLLE